MKENRLFYPAAFRGWYKGQPKEEYDSAKCGKYYQPLGVTQHHALSKQDTVLVREYFEKLIEKVNAKKTTAEFQKYMEFKEMASNLGQVASDYMWSNEKYYKALTEEALYKEITSHLDTYYNFILYDSYNEQPEYAILEHLLHPLTEEDIRSTTDSDITGEQVISSQEQLASNNQDGTSNTTEGQKEKNDDNATALDTHKASNNTHNYSLISVENPHIMLAVSNTIIKENAIEYDSIISVEHLLSWVYKMSVWIQIHILQSTAIAMLSEELKSQQTLFYFNKYENLYIEPSAIDSTSDETEYYGCGEERAVASYEIQHNLWVADSLC